MCVAEVQKLFITSRYSPLEKISVIACPTKLQDQVSYRNFFLHL